MKNIHDITDKINQELPIFGSEFKVQTENLTNFSLSFELKVKPQSHKNKLSYYPSRGFVLDLVDPPVEGKANEGLIRFLAKSFGVSQGQGELLKGLTSKQKSVRFYFTLKPEKNLDYFLKKIKETVFISDEK
jgi:uncharacterized protein YggU (UPF0235/DUF167 family)